MSNIKRFSSRKEVTEFLKEKGIDTSNWSEEKWLKLNKGQAEIHIMDLAEKIYDAVNESEPTMLAPGEWHIPFKDKINIDDIGTNIHDEAYGITIRMFLETLSNINSIKGIPIDVKISTAMAARTSYTIVGDEKEINYGRMVELHDRLLAQDPPHSSPTEHCWRCMTAEEYYSFVKGGMSLVDEDESYVTLEANKLVNNKIFGWCYNAKGFIPYRYFIDNNINAFK